jgi:hypothetical protein
MIAGVIAGTIAGNIVVRPAHGVGVEVARPVRGDGDGLALRRGVWGGVSKPLAPRKLPIALGRGGPGGGQVLGG